MSKFHYGPTQRPGIIKKYFFVLFVEWPTGVIPVKMA
jgi:hypothetical protein